MKYFTVLSKCATAEKVVRQREGPKLVLCRGRQGCAVLCCGSGITNLLFVSYESSVILLELFLSSNANIIICNQNV